MRPIYIRLAIAILLLTSWLAVAPVKLIQTQAQTPLPIYLIIAPESYASELAGLISLQQSRGFDVRTILLPQPIPTQDEIKAEILSQVPSPKYVLLVGDNDVIPSWPMTLPSSEEAQTDLFYVTFDGDSDFVPDAILGRIPVHNTDELSAYIAKLTAYYQFDGYSDTNWFKKIAFVANDNLFDGDDSEDNFEYLISTITQLHGYSGSFTGRDGAIASTVGGDRLFPATYHAAKEDVFTVLNEGRVGLIYNGEASATAFNWKADFPITAGDVSGLESPVVPLVAAFAPKTSDFSATQSMADAWLLNPDSGALVYIGASASATGYIKQDIILTEGFVKGIFSNFTEPSSVGEALQYGLRFACQCRDYEATLEDFAIYQLFGDPSLTIRFPEGALITAPFSNFVAPWGGTVTIPITLRNVGPTEEVFDVEVKSNQGYPLVLDPNPFPITLSPGESETFPLTIQIVTDFPVKTFDTITISATQVSKPIIKTTKLLVFQVFKPSVFFPIIQR